MRTLKVVIAVLLTSFVTGCALKPKKFKVLVSENSLSESSRSINVSIDKERRLYLNEENIGTIEDANQLKERLPQLFKEKGDTTVFMYAPRTISKEDLFKVIDVVKGAGAHPIGLSQEDK